MSLIKQLCSCTANVDTSMPKVLNAIVIKVPARRFFKLVDNKKEYSNRKLVGYTCEQMFDVVSDVKNYKEFVPFCKKSQVVEQRPEFLRANLQIGFPPLSESYTSKVTLIKPRLVRAVCADGSLFHELETLWKFSPGLRSNPQTSIVDFYIRFQFKSVLHAELAAMLFDMLCEQMEKAFITEAGRRYGKASLPAHPLSDISRR